MEIDLRDWVAPQWKSLFCYLMKSKKLLTTLQSWLLEILIRFDYVLQYIVRDNRDKLWLTLRRNDIISNFLRCQEDTCIHLHYTFKSFLLLYTFLEFRRKLSLSPWLCTRMHSVTKKISIIVGKLNTHTHSDVKKDLSVLACVC